MDILRSAMLRAPRNGGSVKRARYIVVEGPIGVGKTSLARILADELQARTILERVDDNPFLGRFYDEPEKYAFQAQLFFLLTRFRQHQELAQQDLFRQNLVADYLFAKDHLFAQVNLDADEFGLYRQLYQLLGARLPKPDLVVYLQARLDVLLARLRKRARDYERRITPEYVQRIAEAYQDFFFHYEDTPLLVVNCSEIDFVSHAEHTADLIREIREMGQGVQHYIPLGSR
jgi:deoxyadenosine/deoxycytidine kinase